MKHVMATKLRIRCATDTQYIVRDVFQVNHSEMPLAVVCCNVSYLTLPRSPDHEHAHTSGRYPPQIGPFFLDRYDFKSSAAESAQLIKT
jgi:hypothetical protein